LDFDYVNLNHLERAFLRFGNENPQRPRLGEKAKGGPQMPRIFALTLPAAVLVLALGACGPKEKVAEAAELETEPPASMADEYDPAQVSPGRVLLETRCTVCHGLNKVENEKGDRADWEEIVDEMIEKGAKLNDAEKATLLDFLVENYAP
jgi:cytochrome c5